MNPAHRGGPGQEAFLLFENGDYAGSLSLCNRLLETTRDPALEILAATNLFYQGKTDDAEACFRDLAVKLPGSSYVHSYLARILETKGDDRAIAEYAAAVSLDLTNQDALRRYAAFLCAHDDDEGAVPVLRRLTDTGKNREDLLNLARVLTRTGRANEALDLFSLPVAGLKRSREYVDTLGAAGKNDAAAETARAIFGETGDRIFLRLYLKALAQADPDTATAEYATVVKTETPDPDILRDYIGFLQDRQGLYRALALVKKLNAISPGAQSRLLECETYAGLGDRTNATAAYETLIRDELPDIHDPGTLKKILRSYRQHLETCLTPHEAAGRMDSLLSREVHAVCLIETARSWEYADKPGEARDRYYRAYRADFLEGGIPYAEYLARTGDTMESEKVMIHILANVRKREDISRIAGVITGHGSLFIPMKRLVALLITVLEKRLVILGSRERRCLADAYLSAAEEAAGREDYPQGKMYCLAGLDVLPVSSANDTTNRLFELLTLCKKNAVIDRPVFAEQVKKPAVKQNPVRELGDRLDLTSEERKIVEFLCTHKTASETDLRKLLGTRRIPGIINRLIKKATAGGIVIIGKKGMSPEGEVYEYAGS
ncbi:MAG: hypothetical protein WC342_02870 [Methanoregula sp.]